MRICWASWFPLDEVPAVVSPRLGENERPSISTGLVRPEDRSFKRPEELVGGPWLPCMPLNSCTSPASGHVSTIMRTKWSSPQSPCLPMSINRRSRPPDRLMHAPPIGGQPECDHTPEKRSVTTFFHQRPPSRLHVTTFPQSADTDGEAVTTSRLRPARPQAQRCARGAAMWRNPCCPRSGWQETASGG